MRLIEADDPSWSELQRGSDPDPYATRSFQLAQAAVLRQRPVLLHDAGDGWSGQYVLLLTETTEGVLARTPQYGGPWLTLSGAPPARAASTFRDALDRTLRGMGVVSEVALMSPFLPHEADVVSVWKAHLEQQICVADLRTVDQRWSRLSKGRRSDITRARRELDFRWRRLDTDGAVQFSESYAAAMAVKNAAPRWILGQDYFLALAAAPDLEIWLSSAIGVSGGAMALFLRAERRAAYLYATRWGTSGGAPSAVLWQAQMELASRSACELLLGGGVTVAVDDPLLAFKASLSDRLVPFHLAARVFDPDAHQRAVRTDQARPLPAFAIDVGDRAS